MKIESVKVEKLFSIGGFNNEKIGFTATVAEGETADQVAGQLFQKIVQIEEILEVYRGISEDLDMEAQRLQWKKEDKKGITCEISDTQDRIETIKDQVYPEDKNVESKLANLKGNLEHLKTLKERLEQQEREIKEQEQQLVDLKKTKAHLKNCIEKGNFSLVDKNLFSEQGRR